MSTKKKRKKTQNPSLFELRLSQCMIVKNEERNIETALRWAKGAVYEQIVVDTGSSDKTVEIAKNLGAKVYHFQWINDFAAAKNYAIEQAKGNWIAFLDADEYFSTDNTKRMISLLKRIQSDRKLRDNVFAINCAIVNIDDAGNPMGILSQERIFRNLPEIRYIGKIHEYLNLSSEYVIKADGLSIIHTGYSETAFRETGKTDRNIELLRKAITEEPNNFEIKAYLGEALLGKEDLESRKEAENLFIDVINENSDNIRVSLKKMAYRRLLEMRIESGDKILESDELGRRAVMAFPRDIDLNYCLGYILNKKREYGDAFEILQACETALLGSTSYDESVIISANPAMLFTQLAISAQGIGSIEGMIKYSSMSLSLYKYQENLLTPYISILHKNEVSSDEIFSLLCGIYDLGNLIDVEYVANAAKKSGDVSLSEKLLSLMND